MNTHLASVYVFIEISEKSFQLFLFPAEMNIAGKFHIRELRWMFSEKYLLNPKNFRRFPRKTQVCFWFVTNSYKLQGDFAHANSWLYGKSAVVKRF